MKKKKKKDTDEQPNEETPRKRSGRALSTGVSVPVELEYVTLSEPCTIYWSFMEVSSCRHDGSLTPFSTLLPSQENGGGRWAGLKIPGS